MPGVYNVCKLRRLGLLWCEGGAHEKAVSFYDLIQEHDDSRIACNDKDFKSNLYGLFDLAIEVAYKYEPLYNKRSQQTAKDKYESVKPDISIYETLEEEIIDKIFDTESKITRKDWENSISKHFPWLFDSQKIRDKLKSMRE